MSVWLPYYSARVQADSVRIHVESLEILYPLDCSIILMDSFTKRCVRGTARLHVSSSGSQRSAFRQLRLHTYTREMPIYPTQIMLGDFDVNSPHDSEFVVVPFYIFLDDAFTYEGLCTYRSKYPLTVELDPPTVWISGMEYEVPPHEPQTLYNYTACSRSYTRMS
ncbi:hypothetical protein FOL47_002788 [Perkinsus chesapeaki]|uniref:Uncharacterized protein n=1 Tax=Perkinsus chesapeaki TaxID=330153 RepID=A0A7J6N066_PERCH|nr:hypothetical protein FOL47_002788 [Perkinsus chesapeaki]